MLCLGGYLKRTQVSCLKINLLGQQATRSKSCIGETINPPRASTVISDNLSGNGFFNFFFVTAANFQFFAV